MSGVDGDTGYLVHTNLTGAYNCLELARRDGAFVVFLSTSRVYPVAPQVALKLEEAPTRFELAAEQDVPGVSPAGISEEFPLDGARTLYGATKLAAELLIEEYRAGLGVPRGDRPLRRDRRALADGQGRPGRLHPLDARPPLPPAAQLHRLRRHGQAGPRPAARRGPGRPGRAPAARPRGLGRRARSTSAAAASAASRCWRRPRSAASSPATRSRSSRSRRRGRGRARSTFPTARDSSAWTSGARGAAPSRSSPTSTTGSRRTRRGSPRP